MNSFKYKDRYFSITCSGYSVDEIERLLQVSRKQYASPGSKEPKVEKPKVQMEKDVEEANLADITRDIRMPKSTSNFRCPSCHQAILINVSSNDGTIHLVRDVRYEKPSTHIVDIEGYGEEFIGIDPVSLIKNKPEIINLYSDLLEILKDPIVLTDDTLSEATCPICGEKHLLNDWIRAFENPMNFDAESHNLCDICGEAGEIELTRTGDSLICKDKCTHKIIK